MGSVPSSLLRRAYGLVPIGLVAGLSLVWASRPTVPVLVRGMGLLAPPEARRGFYARGPGEVQALLDKAHATAQADRYLPTYLPSNRPTYLRTLTLPTNRPTYK